MQLIAAAPIIFLKTGTRIRFPENGSLLLIGQFGDRNAELEWAPVSGEDRWVTTLITAAKEIYVSGSVHATPKKKLKT